MSITDKITGRAKQAAGDLLGDGGLRREGRDEERKGEAKDELRREDERAARAEARADRKADEVDELERRT
jgi:uncharacterized protein YjbJ (UPF0337 family)